MKWSKWFLVLAVVAFVSCGPSLGSRRAVTDVGGLPVDLGAIGGLGCGSIGIGHRPAQADIDLCKNLLPKPDGDTLQVLWEEYDNVTTDGVHNAKVPLSPIYTSRTCPILALYPIQHGHDTGTITDADFAKRIYQFYKEKYYQDLAGKASKVDSRLAAAGLPPLGGSSGGVKNPCPVLVDGKPCGLPSTKYLTDTVKHFKCPSGHEWTKPL